MTVRLVQPSRETLPGFVDALEQGWSPDNIRGKAAADEALARIEQDADGFLAAQHDPEAKGGDIRSPDGTVFRRIPGYIRWLWDDSFCGSIGFRWQPGTADLPEHVLGHIGYAVPPWKRGKGYASQALRQLLPDAWALDLPYVELTTDPDNPASQKVIQNNGGVMVERFRKLAAYGGAESLRWRIYRPD